MEGMRKSRLSDYKHDRLIEHLVAGTTARTAACLSVVMTTLRPLEARGRDAVLRLRMTGLHLPLILFA